ncbi:MAG: glycosyltransferase family 4 protein [Chitinophagaceae bacterium]
MAKKLITVSVISELTTDQRVIRICTTLQQMGFEVKVYAREFSNSLPLDNYSFETKRIRCYFRKGFLQYGEFNIKLFFRLLFSKTDYLLSNDLDTLVPNYIVSVARRKKIFYDTHEYFTGVPELTNHPIKKKVWKFFESRIFPRLPVVYTVNESVKNKYQQEYGNQIGVIRNVPVTTPFVPKEMPEHWKDKIILLMQGIGINPGRGGLELLETMKYLPSNYYLVYIGGGTQWKSIAKMRQEWHLEDRVEMIAKVPPAELKRYTPLASLGFTLDGFESENYLFNLPNKIFDYIQAGVPVVATPIPEVKLIIEQYDCGICLLSQAAQDMARQIEKLMNNPQQYQTLKKNTNLAAKELCWENEQKKLIAIYQPYL